MKAVYAILLKPSGLGWRCTWSNAEGPILSIWAPTCLEASKSADEALRRMQERTDRSGRNKGNDPRMEECG